MCIQEKFRNVVNSGKVGTVVFLSLAVQALSGFTLLLFPLLGAAISDRLAVLTQVGMISYGGVALGLVYNLAIGRPGFASWGKWSTFAVVVSLSASLVEHELSSQRLGNPATQNGYSDVLASVVFGLGGACLGVAGVLGVKRACFKKPFYLTSVTLLPNFGLLAGVLLSLGSGSMIVASLFWLLGCVVTLLIGAYLDRFKSLDLQPISNSETKQNLWLHTVALIIGVVLSSFMPLLSTIALLALAPGTAYVGVLVVRIATAGITLFVNSVLVVKYHWGSRKKFGFHLEIVCALTFAASSILSLILVLVSSAEYMAYFTYVIGWFAGLVASAFLIREMNASKMGAALLIKVCAELVLTLAIIYQLLAAPSLIGFFATVSIGQAFTILFGGFVFKSKALTLCGFVLVGVCLMLVTI
jgi:hypothetical protein